jgi:hypothetical protein
MFPAFNRVMPRYSIPFTASKFRGLDEWHPVNGEPNLTSSLNNVEVHNGRVFGRLGIDEWDGITSAAAATIIGLMSRYEYTNQTAELIRMLPAAVQKWNSGTSAWDAITGTALNGTAATRPQWTNMPLAETMSLIFTNEGKDRPRKYTGTGNTAVLGGTPPFCKALESYVGFLMLGNTSDDGSTFNPIEIRYSDDPDADWTLCEGNNLILDESPGEIRALKVYGRMLLAYKADAIVRITFIGGGFRFQKEKLPFDKGIHAPLSLANVAEFGHIFLGTDLELYRTNGQIVQAMPGNVSRTLQEDMKLSLSHLCVGVADQHEEVYHLFYPSSTASSFLDKRVSVNYRTGEFFRASFPVEFTRALAFREDVGSKEKVLTSSATLVYDAATGTTDNGTAITRTYDLDWHNYGVNGEKWFTGGFLTLAKAVGCRVEVSVAVDFSTEFKQPQLFELRNRNSAQDNVQIQYTTPPLLGEFFKIRVKMIHTSNAGTNVAELISISPEVTLVRAKGA